MDHIKWLTYIYNWNSERQKKGSWTKNTLVAIVAKIFWNSRKTKNTDLKIFINPQENKHKENHSKTHHNKITETHDKDETLKVARKRDTVYTGEQRMADFLSKTL